MSGLSDQTDVVGHRSRCARDASQPDRPASRCKSPSGSGSQKPGIRSSWQYWPWAGSSRAVRQSAVPRLRTPGRTPARADREPSGALREEPELALGRETRREQPLILGHDHYRPLVLGCSACHSRLHLARKVFLKRSCSAGSACGCLGRGRSLRQPCRSSKR